MRLLRRPAPAPPEARLDDLLRAVHGDQLDAIDAAPEPSARFGEIGDDLWALLLTCSYDGWPRIRAALPSVPDPGWQQIWNGRDGAELAEQSLAFYRALRAAADRHLGGLHDARVLDFGCGWGRLTRYLMRDIAPGRLFGCDPVASILPPDLPATLAVHDPRGDRLPFDERFDMAFAFSVFTHLSEAAHQRALDALHAGLRPGGLLVATIRPPGFLPGDGGYRFVPHPAQEDHPQYDGGEMDYGETVVTPGYVRERWAPRFALLESQLLVGDLQQVVLVLRREPGP